MSKIILEENVNLLLTNKGWNIRVITDNSTPIDTFLLKTIGNNIPFLASLKLKQEYPYMFGNNNYPLTTYHPDVPIHGDGKIDLQRQFAKKFKITIEEI